MASSDSEGDEVSNLLECSVCLDICQIPIRQCKNGHNVCESHVRKLGGLCPICREHYRDGSVRNLLAEKLVLKRQKKLEKQQKQEESTKGVAKHLLRPFGAATPNHSTTTNQPRQNQNVLKSWKSCKYEQGGCQYGNFSEASVTTHEQSCHYREIRCCLQSDGCRNAQIEFGDYINHLKSVHKVKTVKNESHWNKYFVNAPGKLVRDGSSSLFILETEGHKFLVTAKECNKRIYVWVALHGLPVDAQTFKTTVMINNTPADSDEDDSTFFGTVRATTRQSLNEVLRLTPCWAVAEVEDVEDSLETQTVVNRRGGPGGGNFIRKYWSVNASISRQPTVTRPRPPQGRLVSSDTPVTRLELPTFNQPSEVISRISDLLELQDIDMQSRIHRLPNTAAVQTTIPTPSPQLQTSEVSFRLSANLADDESQNLRYRAPRALSVTAVPRREVMSEFARDFYETGDRLGKDEHGALTTLRPTPSYVYMRGINQIQNVDEGFHRRVASPTVPSAPPLWPSSSLRCPPRPSPSSAPSAPQLPRTVVTQPPPPVRTQPRPTLRTQPPSCVIQ